MYIDVGIKTSKSAAIYLAMMNLLEMFQELPQETICSQTEVHGMQ